MAPNVDAEGRAHSGWASIDARLFLYRYILSGFAVILFSLLFVHLTAPAAFAQLLAFSREASVVVSAFFIIAVVTSGLILRAIAVDRWPILQKYFLRRYGRMNETALHVKEAFGLTLPGIPTSKHAKAVWLYVQQDELQSRSVDFFEAGFLWWSNFCTAALLFLLALWTRLGTATFPRATYVNAAVATILVLLLVAFSARRMIAYFKNYMLVAEVAMERKCGPFRDAPTERTRSAQRDVRP